MSIKIDLGEAFEVPTELPEGVKPSFLEVTSVQVYPLKEAMSKTRAFGINIKRIMFFLAIAMGARPQEIRIVTNNRRGRRNWK